MSTDDWKEGICRFVATLSGRVVSRFFVIVAFFERHEQSFVNTVEYFVCSGFVAALFDFMRRFRLSFTRRRQSFGYRVFPLGQDDDRILFVSLKISTIVNEMVS